MEKIDFQKKRENAIRKLSDLNKELEQLQSGSAEYEEKRNYIVNSVIGLIKYLQQFMAEDEEHRFVLKTSVKNLHGCNYGVYVIISKGGWVIDLIVYGDVPGKEYSFENAWISCSNGYDTFEKTLEVWESECNSFEWLRMNHDLVIEAVSSAIRSEQFLNCVFDCIQ